MYETTNPKNTCYMCGKKCHGSMCMDCFKMNKRSYRKRYYNSNYTIGFGVGVKKK